MDPSNDETTATGDENPCKEYWALKRKRRRENKKASKTEEASKAKKLEEGSSPADSIEEAQNAAPKVKKNKEIQFHDPRIVIDLSFGDQMNAKRIRSLASQIIYSYSALRRHERPCHLELTSLIPNSLTEQVLSKNEGFAAWKVTKESRPVEEAHSIDKLVFLSPDSDNLLETVDPNKIYIIGGIVDDNQLKGLSLSKAKKHGISHAKLQIKDHLASFKNVSLNINHIVEILLSLANGKTMKEALESTVPQRYLLTTAKGPWRSEKKDSDSKEQKEEEKPRLESKLPGETPSDP